MTFANQNVADINFYGDSRYADDACMYYFIHQIAYAFILSAWGIAR
jgi:hypothetical protein